MVSNIVGLWILCVKLLTAPLLLVQGKWVRKTALILPEPDGERSGIVTAHPQARTIRVLILGDSAAAGVGVPHQQQALAIPFAKHLSELTHCNVAWQLIAQSGQTCLTIQDLLKQQAKAPFDYVIMSLGVNDVTSLISQKTCLAKRDALLGTLTQELGVKHLVHSALPPVGKFPLLPHPLRWVLGQDAKALDQTLLTWAANTPNVSVCPAFELQGLQDSNNIALWIAKDGFHPGPQTYAMWSKQLATHLLTHINSN